ncbi:MAG: hypothetical protein KY453_12830 [Gemmatimonadetes bacterium]|nr:hypothetical protein [Gemmatimonadota bacterium]
MKGSMWTTLAAAALVAACAGETADDGGAAAGTAASAPGWQELRDSTARVAVVDGLSGPEAVKYDPDQDVWFVSNFGDGSEQPDGDGFIARVSPDGAIEELAYMRGTEAAPLEDPRGMALRGDTLWVADAAGVHGFDRRTGAHAAFVDFRSLAPGFINDLAFGPDGELYATDTGRSRVYRVSGGVAEIAAEDPRLGPPNGIVWDEGREAFLLGTWGGDRTLRTWSPGGAIEDVATSEAGANFDGVELWDGRAVLASQADSSLHVMEGSTTRPFLRVPGRPADIAIDTRRGRVAVPYIALDRVDVWDLPRDPAGG